MRRKLLLTIICVFALFGVAKAQTSITMGEGKGDTESFYQPIGYYGYSVSQQLYTAEELQSISGKSITSLTFKKSSGVASECNIIVYMKNVDKETFTGKSDWVSVSDSDIVYQGKWSLPEGAVDVNLDLTTDFVYTGGDLLLCVYDKTGIGSTRYFTCYGRSASALCYISSSAISPSNLILWNTYLKDCANVVTFTLASENGPEKPAAPSVAAAANGQTSIVLSWDAVKDATSYDVYEDATLLANVTETTYTATGLAAGSNHCYTVKAKNEAGESEASEEACATTDTAAQEEPEDGVVTVEIGEDKNPSIDNSYSLPSYEWAFHSISQQIYTEEEFEGHKGDITSISFKVGNSVTSTVTRKYAVYLKDTDLNAFADNQKDFVSLSSKDKVFEGDVVISNKANEWVTINLDTPYKYDGGNLLVCVNDKTGSKIDMSNMHMFYKYTVDYNASIYKYNAFENEAYALSQVSDPQKVLNYKNQIKVTIAPSAGEDPEQPGGEEPEQPGDDDEPVVDYTTVEIGDDKNPVAEYYLPSYDYVNYSLSQQIYTEEDFEGNLGAVHSVSFKIANNPGGATVRQYEVYMKHTNRDDLTGNYETITAEDKVFDGEVEIPSAMGSWYKITFDKPFDYGGGNVMICVYDKSGSPLTNKYHMFYQYETGVNRAMFSQGNTSYDVNSLTAGSIWTKVNQVKFEIQGKPIVKVGAETIDLGECMLGNYWSERAATKVDVRAVSTTITKIETDNAFFVLPEDIDYTSEMTLEIAYDETANVDGAVNGNLVITHIGGVLEVPMTAIAYTPKEGDVYELAKEVVFEGGAFADTPAFADLHDNYSLPKELEDGEARDIVYAFELKAESLITAKVAGTNANVAIYSEDFGGNEGPSSENNNIGNIEVASEFFYDFNDGFIIGWVAKDYDGNNYSWENTSHYYGATGAQYGVDNTHCIISYSSNNAYGILAADNVIMTEKVYSITENSMLSFDAFCMDPAIAGGTDHVCVEVSKDGEAYTLIEEITPGYGKFDNFEVNLGAKFATLGLEYGDYHIALRHKEADIMHVRVDNIRLSNGAKTRSAEAVIYAIPYPAGKYYLVAAAEGQFSVELNIVDPDKLPLAPENVVATTIDEFSIELTWEASQNSTSYNIYRDDKFLVNVKELAYTDDNLTPNTDYCYVVKGYNDVLESVSSVKACARTVKLILDYPATVTAEPASPTSIVLKWSKVEKAAGYKIYWGEEVVDIVSDTTYTVEGLTSSTEYCYMISSLNKNIESFEKSVPACATTLDLLPDVPTNLKAEATSSSTLKLSWDVAENAKRYYIYSADTLVAKTAYTEYNIVGLNPDTEYCYTVTAVNGDLESDPSQEICVKTLPEGIAELTSSINIYPNPVNDKLYIEAEVEILEVSVYDVYGRQQSTVNGQQSLSIDVNELNSGVYFVKVVTSEGDIVKRFIKK